MYFSESSEPYIFIYRSKLGFQIIELIDRSLAFKFINTSHLSSNVCIFLNILPASLKLHHSSPLFQLLSSPLHSKLLTALHTTRVLSPLHHQLWCYFGKDKAKLRPSLIYLALPSTIFNLHANRII